MFLPSDALLQHLPSYLGFSYLGCGVSLHGCSSKAQPLLLTLDEGYLLTAALPDLQRGMAPLGLPALVQPLLLGHWVAPCGCRPWHRAQGGSSWLPPFGHGIFPASTPDLVCGVAPLGGAYVRRSQPPALSVIKGKEIETVEVTASVQFSSVAQSCPTLCNPMNCSTPGLPVHHQLPEFTQIHVHRVST